MSSEKILFFKLGGIGDAIDATVMLGGVRKKHPDAVITAIVRDPVQMAILKGVYRTDTLQPACDFVRPALHQVRFWHWARDVKLAWDTAWQMETRDATWDYAYDARPYIGRVFRFRDGVPSVYYPPILSAEDDAAYNNPTSLWTHKLASRNQTTIELMNGSMNLQADWSEVDIHTPSTVRPVVHDDYVILSNATDTKKPNTKQWSFSRFGEVALHLRKNNLIPIQLGLPRDKFIPGCVDWRGKTTLLEAIEIVRRAKLVVSIEGGVARMAGLVKTPSVVIFTSTPVSLFRVPRSLAVEQSACALENGCFWRTGEWMTECMLEKVLRFKNKEDLPICSGEIRTESVMEAIDRALCDA